MSRDSEYAAMLADDSYDEDTLRGVDREHDGYAIHFTGGMSFWVGDQYDDDAPHGVVPLVGSVVRMWGGLGRPVRGLMVDGRLIYFRTEQQQRDRHAAEVEINNAERRHKWEQKGRAELAEKYAALPAVFQQRIDKFRANNPDFGWQYEGYEMFVCEQAVVIADALKTADEIAAFAKLDWHQQKLIVPNLDGGHSGNTFGAACRLAQYYLARPEGVVAMHGALAPLVGSEEYGCVPRGKADSP